MERVEQPDTKPVIIAPDPAPIDPRIEERQVKLQEAKDRVRRASAAKVSYMQTQEKAGVGLFTFRESPEYKTLDAELIATKAALRELKP